MRCLYLPSPCYNPPSALLPYFDMSPPSIPSIQSNPFLSTRVKATLPEEIPTKMHALFKLYQLNIHPRRLYELLIRRCVFFVFFISSSRSPQSSFQNITLFFPFISSFVTHTKRPPPVIPDSTGRATAEKYQPLFSPSPLLSFVTDGNHHVYPHPQRACPSPKPVRLQITHLSRHASDTVAHSVSDVLQPGMIFQTCESTRECRLPAPTLLSSHRTTESKLQSASLLPKTLFHCPLIPNRTVLHALSSQLL